MIGRATPSLTLACLLAFAPAVQAQDDGDESALPEEVIVTATRLPVAAERLPFAAAVVGREEIQNARQQLGLDEALAGVPGLFFQNRYNFAQDLRIAIRGFGTRANFGIRGIRLIADDIPLTTPDGQGSVDAIDLGSAESIEVIRGPFSAVYGSSSGGVILIRSEEGPESTILSGRLNVGDYGFVQGQLKAGGTHGAMNYMANISHTRLDGYRDQSETENTLLNSRLRFDLDDSTRLTVVVNAVDSPQADDPGALTAAEVAANPRQAAPRNVLFNAGEALDQQSIGAALRRDYGNGSELLLRAHYVQRDFANSLPFDINANGQGGAVDLDRAFYGFGGHWARPLGDTARLVMGVEYAAQRDHRLRYANNLGVTGDLTTNQDEDADNLAAFVEASWSATDRLDFTAGARYDEIEYDFNDRLDMGGSGETDFSAFSPMLGLSFAWRPGLNLYANVSQSFDPPATTELANPDAPTGFNQDLKEQTATNYEIGFKGEAGRSGRFELALFHIDIDDVIVPFELSGSGQSFFENAGSATHDGIEVALGHDLTEALNASLSYTWSDFETDGLRVPGIPENLAQAGLRWRPVEDALLAFDILYASSFYADNANTVETESYTVADLRFEYRWRTSRLEISPFAGINNLFDEAYNGNVRLNAAFGRYYEPAPGRNVYAGVVVRFP